MGERSSKFAVFRLKYSVLILSDSFFWPGIHSVERLDLSHTHPSTICATDSIVSFKKGRKYQTIKYNFNPSVDSYEPVETSETNIDFILKELNP